eukprot:IDg6227t1
MTINVLREDERDVQSAIALLIGSNAMMSIAMLDNMPGEEENCQFVSDDALIYDIVQGMKYTAVMRKTTLRYGNLQDLKRYVLLPLSIDMKLAEACYLVLRIQLS